MQRGFRFVAASAIVVTASLVIRADVTNPSQSTEIQLQLGDLLFSEGRFQDSLDAYKNALKTASPDAARPRARPSRHGEVARGARHARRCDERGAGGAAARAARPRDPSHRRHD